MTNNNEKREGSGALVVAQPPGLLQPLPPADPPERVSLAGVLGRRWLTAAAVFVISASALVSTIWLRVTPKYEVIAQVHVAPRERAILFRDQDTDFSGGYHQYMATQALHMVGHAVLAKALHTVDPTTLLTTTDPAEAIRGICDEVEAKHVPNTELLELTVVGADRDRLITFADAVVDAYLRRYEEENREWDETILRSLKNAKSALDEKLRKMNSDLKQLAHNTNGVDAKNGETVTEQLVIELQKLLTETMKSRAVAEAKRNSLEGGDPVEAAIRVNPTAFQEVLAADEELKLLIQKQISTQLPDPGEESSRWGPEHPLAQQRQEMSEAMAESIERRKAFLREMFAASVRAELEAEILGAKAIEATLNEALEGAMNAQLEAAAGQLRLDDLRHQREFTEGMLNQVIQKMLGVEIEQKRQSRVKIASPAYAPREPNIDKRPKYTAAALAFCLALACGCALLRDRLDNSLWHPGEVSRLWGLRLLGSVERVAVPRGRRRQSLLLTDERVHGPVRGICTALLASRDRNPRSRLISSPHAKDGKSSLAMHLGRVLASTGRRVLLVDADNVGRGLSRGFQLADQPGLKELLEGDVVSDSLVVEAGIHDLHVLPAGTRDRRFDELIHMRSAEDRLRALFGHYDEVIVDGPPVLASSDALRLATIVDEVVVVLRAESSSRQCAFAAFERLHSVGARIAGVVFNAVDPKVARGAGSSYYASRYYEYGKLVPDDERSPTAG